MSIDWEWLLVCWFGFDVLVVVYLELVLWLFVDDFFGDVEVVLGEG